jgi:hypothetical protein
MMIAVFAYPKKSSLIHTSPRVLPNVRLTSCFVIGMSLNDAVPAGDDHVFPAIYLAEEKAQLLLGVVSADLVHGSFRCSAGADGT